MSYECVTPPDRMTQGELNKILGQRVAVKTGAAGKGGWWVAVVIKIIDTHY